MIIIIIIIIYEYIVMLPEAVRIISANFKESESDANTMPSLALIPIQ